MAALLKLNNIVFMLRKTGFVSFFILLFCAKITGYAQDIEQALKNVKATAKEDPLAVTGSLGASSVFYNAIGIAPRRDPFNWVINANLTFSIFNKITIPFAATFTQQDKNFTNGLDKFSQPFNQMGISPRYKWLTVHAGYRSIELSEYSLSGAMFLGGGIEVNPEKSFVSGTVLFGRFVRAVPIGGVDGITVSLPAYQRWGGGGKIKVGKNNNYGEFVFFRAKDNEKSIAFDTSLSVTPSENQVIGINSKQQINKWLNTEGSFTYSMFTNNLYDEAVSAGKNYMNGIYTSRSSSQYNKAITAGINFTPKKIKLGLKYKRIDPDYKTLGAIFLTNDVEEYSVNTSCAIYKNKINISASSGLQQNNLDKIQAATSKRFIGCLNFSYSVTEHLNFVLNYSNFSSNTIPVRDVFTDSIKLLQLTQSEGANINYSFGKGKIKHNLSFNTAYQESGGNRQSLSTFANGVITYNITLPAELAFNASVIYNQSYAGASINVSAGPSLGIQKSLLNKKMRLHINSSLQNASLNKVIINKNIILNCGGSYSINKYNSLKLETSYLTKIAEMQGAKHFSEYRGTVSYLYTFATGTKNVKVPVK